MAKLDVQKVREEKRVEGKRIRDTAELSTTARKALLVLLIWLFVLVSVYLAFHLLHGT